jgi:hypothetical protein
MTPTGLLDPSTSLADTHPHLVAEWDTEANDRTPAEVSAGSSYRAHWQCAVGHRWQATLNNRSRGSNCPHCSTGAKPLILGVSDLATTHPHLVTEWDTEANDRTPGQVTAGSHYRAHWTCPNGHHWQAPVFNRTRGSGCPYCSGRRSIPGRTDLATTHPHLAAEWDTEANDRTPEQITAGSHYKARWVCPSDHRWQAKVHARVAGRRCPTCNRRGRKPAALAPRPDE